MFRANQTAYLSNVIVGILGKWGVAREQKNTEAQTDRPSTQVDDGQEEALHRRRRCRNRRYAGLGLAGSAPLKTGWS